MGQCVRDVAEAARIRVGEETSAFDVFNASHVLGTCRFGFSPNDSVADADGFSHEIKNLGFADGSVLPSTSHGDSPFLTITALALRLGDKIVERARRSA
jgi:choline dehydrogenase-like flavoprotein